MATTGSRLDALLSVWQRRREAGAEPSAAELCRDCPELLPARQRHLDAWKKMDPLLGPAGDPALSAPPVQPAPLPAGTPDPGTDTVTFPGAPLGRAPAAAVPGYE